MTPTRGAMAARPARASRSTSARSTSTRANPTRVTSSRANSAARSGAAPSGLRGTLAQVPTATMLGVVVGLLCIIGLVMVGSASSVISIADYGTPWAILLRECMWMAIGLFALWASVKVDYRRLRPFTPWLLIGTFGLLLVVLVPGVGAHVDGSSRWVGFGQFRIQPSELMKLALALFAADFIARRLDEKSSERRIMGPVLLVTAIAGGLILVQPDMGTALVVGCIALTLLFVSGVRLGPVFKLLGLLVVLALIVAIASPYRRERLLSFLDPSAHGAGSGYQVVQSLIGLGSGHLFGAGIGGGQQQWGFLPNAHTDFIFSVIGEQLGFVGAAAVLLLLGTLVWLGIRAATRCPDRFGGLLAVGLVAWIASEALINIGAVVGVLPVTGIPLPFISFGGSSLVITMVAAGLLINIARQERSGAGHGLVALSSSNGSRRPARPATPHRRGR
jgi:cell division protein FtsW